MGDKMVDLPFNRVKTEIVRFSLKLWYILTLIVFIIRRQVQLFLRLRQHA